MKALLPLLLIAAAGAAGWLYVTRPGPTYVPPSEAQVVYAAAPSVLTRAPAEGEAEIVLDVHGMCCHGCTGKLHARLMEQAGVIAAAIDLEAGTASALVEASVEPAALAAALTFDKYSAQPHSIP